MTTQEKNHRARPTAPASRRPPRVVRERKPALAALALLLIAGGALGAAYLVVQNAHRVAAIEVTQPLGPGQQIPVSALREVDIAPGAVGRRPLSCAGCAPRVSVPRSPGMVPVSPCVPRRTGVPGGPVLCH